MANAGQDGLPVYYLKLALSLVLTSLAELEQLMADGGGGLLGDVGFVTGSFSG